MKKVFLVCLMAVLVAGPAFAVQTIVGSKHDLSDSGGGTQSDYSEVCVFCHTPHNATIDNDLTTNPLWNRTIGAVSVTNVYNNSTFTFAATLTTTDVIDTDLTLCMTCHAGSAYGSVVNPSNLAGDQPNFPVGSTLPPNAFLDPDFQNDHPVGFSYAAAVASDAELVATPQYNGVNVFSGDDTVQCSTCHDVHDKTYNFIRTKMSGSMLCLACHIK